MNVATKVNRYLAAAVFSIEEGVREAEDIFLLYT
jgi:hypothetical protein